MENFILKIVTIICVSFFSVAIVRSRKDDISISSVLIATIMEMLSVIIVFAPEILSVIKEIIALF